MADAIVERTSEDHGGDFHERLADFTTLLEQQGRRIDAQAAEIERLRAPQPPVARPPGDGKPASRRTALHRMLTGAAAVIGALVAGRPKPAAAASRTNAFGTAGTAKYGLLAIRGQVTDPDLYLPSLASVTDFGVIGMTDQTFTAAVSNAGVLGLSSGKTAVLGMDMQGVGVRGQSSSGI